MKIEFDLPDEFTNEELAIVYSNKPVPVAYMNVYEKGDVWLKIKGCDSCPPEQAKKCCGRCPLVSDMGCFLHLDTFGKNKPFNCVVKPSPRKHMANCALEYKCVCGTYSSLTHKLCNPRGVLTDEQGKDIQVDLT
jgi:hypothetical protein